MPERRLPATMAAMTTGEPDRARVGIISTKWKMLAGADGRYRYPRQ
jgi:hypothetical protein